MANQLAQYRFVPAPNDQQTLTIATVEISARADMLVEAEVRGRAQIGAAILRMTQDDADTDNAIERRHEMGTYVATLARMQLDQNIGTAREPANRLCMSIDIQHGAIFSAPNSNARRMNDVQNACIFIAAIWPNI
jgi:hypothetical protein